MGKGNRNSQKRIEDQLAQEEKLLAKEKAQKAKKNGDRWIAITCIVLAVVIVAILAVSVLKETGVTLRLQNAIYVEGEKDVSVNAAMLTFFTNDYIANWYNNNYYYILVGGLSVDFNADLREQKMTATDANYMGDSSLVGTTWYDYFRNSVIENVEMYVLYAYMGKDIPECQLDDEDIKEVEDSIADIKKNLKETGYSFSEQYGQGVTEGDVRDCLMLISRASKFGEYKVEQVKDKFEKDDSLVVKYPDEHKEDFYSAKYLSYTINVSEKTEKTQARYDQAVKDAKAAAEKLATAKTPADFVTFIELYKESPSAFINGTTSADKSEDAAQQAEDKTEGKTEEKTEKETTIEELIDKYTGSINYQTGDELGDWIFEETAEENDVNIIEETGTEVVTEKNDKKETSKETGTEGSATEADTEEEVETDSKGNIVHRYDKYKVTVYMLLEKPSMDVSFTHNMAYLITDNKESAEAFLKAFLASNEKTRDNFEKLAKAEYDKLHKVDEHGDHNHAEGETEPTFSYAKVDQAKEKYFATSYDALNTWLDDDKRVAGEYTSELITVEVENNDADKTKTKYYAVLLYEDQDDPAWYVDAFNATVQKDIDDWYEVEIKKPTVTYNFDAIDAVIEKIGG